KEPLLGSLRITGDSLQVMTKVFSGLRADPGRIAAAMTPELYATERACRLVEQGVPFRQAYRTVAANLRPA
ncbi:MAG: argininosuccinate lyase, partial [Elusimicrobia bacterium]|nr:argininosuccinate lyase [Elusimicrobiota bacterium]